MKVSDTLHYISLDVRSFYTMKPIHEVLYRSSTEDWKLLPHVFAQISRHNEPKFNSPVSFPMSSPVLVTGK